MILLGPRTTPSNRIPSPVLHIAPESETAMPSIDAPTHYERSTHIAPGRADDFFKSLTPDDAIAETGDVESPLGYIMLVCVTRDMVAEYVSTEGDPWMSEARNFEPGWYIVKTDDNGLIWGIGYGPLDSTLVEENARADYASGVAVYDAWATTPYDD